jgi:hypothetical protein
MLLAPKGKPGSKAFAASKQKSTALSSALVAPVVNAAAFSSGTVYLYNSDHPEWLSPVASGPTDSTGAYSLSKLANAAANNGAYTDGADIPAGNYTLLAYKSGGFDPVLGVTTTALVAVQTVVNKFEGTVTAADLVAQESTALPTVTAMFGQKQNTDGTQTWGSAATSMPTNAAIQVNFSAAMSRGSLTNGITISPTVSGKWSLSADWTTATFYPDTGVTLAPGTVYTIKVNGSDTGATAAVKNVYGNALAKTATGTFTATAVDALAPTAIFVSPTTAQMASPVDVTVPIRIGSNKQLDVNGLTLEGKIAGVSSLGAKPGVLYVGHDAASGLYVYEFVLGVPLKLGTTYDLSVSGGKGLNGVAMNALNVSIQTASAAATTGVDATATTATQDAQAAVKDVLGKWIRAFSDRNITQLQSMMSGDFYFEESRIDTTTDLNKDGRLSLAEFSNMLTTQAFPNWEFCGTTITGDVVGTINVVGDMADFEFNMVGTSTNTSQQCVGSLPAESFYATVQKLNGAWTIVRASVGIDTRTKTISFPNLIDTLSISQNGATVADGGTIQLNYPDPVTFVEINPVTFSWGATTGVSSYVLIRMDARDPQNGKACALPSSVTSFDTASGCVALGGVNISGKFGFNTNSPLPLPPALHVDGGQYYWEVIGLGTTTVSTIANKLPADVLKDVTAISALHSYNIAGVYKEITVDVVNAGTGMPVTYSVNYDGYDVGAANQAIITVHTGNLNATGGFLDVSGNFYKSYMLTFTNGVSQPVTVDLSTGFNWINVTDSVSLYKGFSITTTGGLAPVVKITSIKDQAGVALSGDQWHYYKAPGATSVTVTGNVTDPAITAVDVNVNNGVAGAWSYVTAPVTGGSFTVTVDIYKGDNWINVGAGYSDPVVGWTWFGDHAGVYTDTGTAWVPNISITSVTTASLTGDYGMSSDWDASLDTDNIATIKGKFKTIANGSYNISSDGGWNSGTLVVLNDGTFSLDVNLFNGWNYVSIMDANSNWYGINVYTSNGKVVVKPTITGVNGVAPAVSAVGDASATAVGCTATVTGTAKAGDLNIYWNGFDGAGYYYESQKLVLSGAADTPISFSFSVPLVGGAGSYNLIDVYDLNWMWTGVKVTTSGTCSYAGPAMTASVLNSAGAAVAYDALTMSYPVGVSPTVTLTGTSNRAGRTITANAYACTSQTFTATASSTANASGTYDWTISNIPVYDGWNSLSVSDGFNWQDLPVTTTNMLVPQSVMTTTVSPATKTSAGWCGGDTWDAGTALTVTITGTTTAPDGTGNYIDAGGANRTFTVAGGAFTIPNVALYDGFNFIAIYDTAWNQQGVSINTINGVAKPQFVAITAPVQTFDAVTGAMVAFGGINTVTGTITDATGIGYAPAVVRGNVYNFATGVRTYYSSDAYDQTMYGDLPITYAGNSFSFNVDFGAGDDVLVDVYAFDDVISVSHGVTQEFNYPWGNYSYYYKPGAKTAGIAKNKAATSELMKQRLKSINRSR